MSDSTNLINESNQDVYAKILSIAEKVISSINDPEIVQKYFSYKSRVFEQESSNPTSPTNSNGEPFSSSSAFSLYKSLKEENEKLKREIDSLTLKKPDFSSDPQNEIIASRLRDLQSIILPKNPTLPPQGSAVQELENLKKVVSAKLESLDYIRSQLKNENLKLQQQIRQLEAELSDKLAKAKEKEDAEQFEIEKKERALVDELEIAQNEYNEIKAKAETAAAENEKLKKQHNEAVNLIESIESDTKNAEAAVERMESESMSLVEEIEQLKTQLKKSSNELDGLKTLQKLGVGDESSGTDIQEEIERLEEKARQLKDENSQMEWELKRLEKEQSDSSASIPVMTAASLNEDDLTAQILGNKWKL